MNLRVESWHYVLRVAVAFVLLWAAWSKGVVLASDAIAGPRIWESRPFLIGLVLVEMSLGVCFVFGAHVRRLWFLALAMFLVFGVFNVYLAVRGETRCSCLGRREITPLAMAVLDFLLAAALGVCPPGPGPDLPPATVTRTLEPAYRIVACGLTVVLIAIPATLSMVFHSHQGLALDLRADRRLQVFLEKKLLKNPRTEDLSKLLEEATGLQVAVDDALVAAPPAYGAWSVGGPAWSVMIGVGERQVVPARWDRTDQGYRLVAAVPWGNRNSIWWTSGVLLFLGYLGLLTCFLRKVDLRSWKSMTATQRDS